MHTRSWMLLAVACTGCVSLRDARLVESYRGAVVSTSPYRCGPVGFRRAPLGARWGEYLRVTASAPRPIVGTAQVVVNGRALPARTWESDGALAVMPRWEPLMLQGTLGVGLGDFSVQVAPPPLASYQVVVVDETFTNDDPQVPTALSAELPIDVTLATVRTAGENLCDGVVFRVEQGVLQPNDESAWAARLELEGGAALVARREARRQAAEATRLAALEAQHRAEAVRAAIAANVPAPIECSFRGAVFSCAAEAYLEAPLVAAEVAVAAPAGVALETACSGAGCAAGTVSVAGSLGASAGSAEVAGVGVCPAGSACAAGGSVVGGSANGVCATGSACAAGAVGARVVGGSASGVCATGSGCAAGAVGARAVGGSASGVCAPGSAYAAGAVGAVGGSASGVCAGPARATGSVGASVVGGSANGVCAGSACAAGSAGVAVVAGTRGGCGSGACAAPSSAGAVCSSGTCGSAGSVGVGQAAGACASGACGASSAGVVVASGGDAQLGGVVVSDEPCPAHGACGVVVAIGGTAPPEPNVPRCLAPGVFVTDAYVEVDAETSARVDEGAGAAQVAVARGGVAAASVQGCGGGWSAWPSGGGVAGCVALSDGAAATRVPVVTSQLEMSADWSTPAFGGAVVAPPMPPPEPGPVLISAPVAVVDQPRYIPVAPPAPIEADVGAFLFGVLTGAAVVHAALPPPYGAPPAYGPPPPCPSCNAPHGVAPVAPPPQQQRPPPPRAHQAAPITH